MMLKQVVLGFLIERPMHGYELKRRLSPAMPPERMLNDGVLYPLLRRMEDEGLLRKRIERRDRGPDRHVYSATDRGRREFEHWLRSPDQEQDDVDYDFLLGHPFLAKFVFFGLLDPDDVRAKVRAQAESSAEKLKTFERIRTGMVERGVDPYRVAVLDLGIAQQRERVRWLKRLEKDAVTSSGRSDGSSEGAREAA